MLKYRLGVGLPSGAVAHKIADEVVFRHFQGEGLEFFKSDLTDPLLDFSVGFISRSCFESDGVIAYSNE